MPQGNIYWLHRLAASLRFECWCRRRTKKKSYGLIPGKEGVTEECRWDGQQLILNDGFKIVFAENKFQQNESSFLKKKKNRMLSSETTTQRWWVLNVCLSTSVSTGRERLAGKRQPDPGQGSETGTALHTGQRVAVRPAGGATEMDWDARVAPLWAQAKLFFIYPQQGVGTAVPRTPFIFWGETGWERMRF